MNKNQVGMVGLGVMGQNLLLNMNDHGFKGSGFDTDPNKVADLKKHGLYGANSVQDFLASLQTPRVIMLLVPAGHPVDAAIKELLPGLQKGDIIIDGGNSYFKDSEVRSKNLAEKGIHFFGVGISGGEEGARHGPSIMPGGSKEGYQKIRALLEACSAKVGKDPCVAYLGSGGAGHFVKMVHNGIEYGIMQLISEAYDLMKRGLDLNDDEIQKIFATWNDGELNGYLMEITGNIFKRVDQKTGKRLIDEILDEAKQKGTGMWTSQCAMELHIPIPTIDYAVEMRDMSMMAMQRKRASTLFPRPQLKFQKDKKVFIESLRKALYAGIITVYAQGMSVLSGATGQLPYTLNLEDIARIWRGGCIIRSALLEDFRNAYQKDPHLPNLLLDPELSSRVHQNEEALRQVISTAITLGIPFGGFMTVLGYIDGYSSAWLPANLIQAQRDYFGSHTYERIDAKGTFHTDWEQSKIL